MAEMEGPGCIWRIWSANPQGRIRFYFDGAETPSLEYDFEEIFAGGIRPFLRPLVWQRKTVLGGTNPASDSYLPIPYARSCKVTADKAHGQYYHIGYSTFPEDWAVKTFSVNLTPEESKALDNVIAVLGRPGQDPQPRENEERFERPVTIPPGRRIEIGRLTGPSTIRGLLLKTKAAGRWGRRSLLLEIAFDGEARPSVQAPVADFFGDAWDGATYGSLPLGIGEEWSYCFWRMPFERTAAIAVTNAGRRAADVTLRATLIRGPLPPGTGRFHARWRRDRESGAFDYPFIECAGRGRFVGVALFVHNIVGGWWGEGDEKAYVDGEKFPSTFGTGSEDYFGDAWGIRHFANPFHGCPTREEKPRQSCYRWHISDSIPFASSFRMTIEDYAALRAEPGRNDYSSVAFWYQEPGGSDFFEAVKPGDQEPQTRVVLGAIEAEGAAAGALPPSATVVSDTMFPEEMSGGKGLRISGPKGTTVSLSLPAPADGRYAIETLLAPGVPAAAVEVLVDGKPATGAVALRKGPNPIEVRVGGDAPDGRPVGAVVDAFLLHPWRNFIRSWYVVGPFDNPNASGFVVDFGPEARPFEPDAEFDGIGVKVRWRALRTRSGLVGPEDAPFPRKDDIVLYAYCEVEAPEARRTAVLLGSDDGAKVWVNGRLVHSKAARRALVPDQDRFEVDLAKGRNTVLLKVEQGGGPWGFSLRFDDPEERIRVVLPE